MDILTLASSWKSKGKTFVLSLIVKTTGSAPREAGAKMLVSPAGSIEGTLGGGNFEKMVIDDSLALLNSGSKHLFKKYRFSREGKGNTDMCCGGEAEVYMEVIEKQKKLVVFGGGHVGSELVRIAKSSDLSIIVVDDRQEILDMITDQAECILTDSNYSKSIPDLDSNCYVVITTRSHDCDRIILSSVITKDCAYVGMIGSRAKIKKMFTFLEQSGISSKLLERVHAPIGIEIGAEGPFEIALSIMTQIVSVKNSSVAIANESIE